MGKKHTIDKSNTKIFISTSHREPDFSLAKLFAKELERLGHKIFLAKESINIGEEWQSRLSQELDSVDYMILLLSKNSVRSEMVYWEVKKIKDRQNGSNIPTILPIRVNLPYDVNYDLSKQLENIHQLDWEEERDTPIIIEKISNSILKNTPFGVSKKRLLLTHSKKPVPNAPLIVEQPSGTVALDSRYYIERSDDQKCYNTLDSRYTLIRIKAPRQYGKTSLLARVILEAKEREYKIVSFNFQEDFDKSILNNLNGLLSCIYNITASRLEVEVKINEMLLKMLTPKMIATTYMEEILSSIKNPFLLAIDEADRLFEFKDVSNEFFGLIRSWHEKSKSDPKWEKMKIILSHSTEPLLGTEDLNQSPFHNVGLGIELQPFRKEEMKTLALRHGIELKDELDTIMELIGGHPYLSRVVLYNMVEERISLRDIIQNAYTQKSIFLDHLKRYLWIINENQRLKNSIKEIIKGNSCKDDYSCYTLEATGLIKNRLDRPEFSCKLYRDFFGKFIL